MKRNACQKCAFAVRDDSPHCGLRGFTTSFNVEWCSAENDKAPNGYELQEDGYFSWVVKKKEYPKTYEECCNILNYKPDFYDEDNYLIYGYMCDKLRSFQKLLVCLDAYWKIAGEEMGLGKPWAPDWNDVKQELYGLYNELKHTIINPALFVFPTEEMRDAFKANFDSDIEICKKML